MAKLETLAATTQTLGRLYSIHQSTIGVTSPQSIPHIATKWAAGSRSTRNDPVVVTIRTMLLPAGGMAL
jgi:hypothetical protein